MTINDGIALSGVFPELQVETSDPRSTPNDEIELNMLIFTETYSSEDGFYYVCRRGMDTIAYFGLSSVLYLSGETVFALEFPNSKQVKPIVMNPSGSETNYLFGNDPKKWRTGIQDSAILQYSEIYPGIDLVYKFQDGNLKYEFIVAPFADPADIQLMYRDVDSIEIDGRCLKVHKDGHHIVDSQLSVFYETQSSEIDCEFSLDEEGIAGFDVHEYDKSQTLVIDPILLAYSTFIGGSNHDNLDGLVVEDGFIYCSGYTQSSNFPIINAYDSDLDESYDCFLLKFTPDGQSLIYSTFFGGNGNDQAYNMAVENGFPYVTGYTTSTDFPTFNAYDDILNGSCDCFVTKFAVDGQSLNFSTYLGGDDLDQGDDITVEDGFAYVSGRSYGAGYPTISAYDSTYNGAADCVVTKFAVNGQSLIYSTYLGASSNEIAWGIAVENSYAYITGQTSSAAFPVQGAYDGVYNGGTDVFVTKLGTSGSTLEYSTFIGGTLGDSATDIAVEDKYAYVTGQTSSSNFPTVNAYDSTHNGDIDNFVTKLNTIGNDLVYSTYIGGSETENCRSITVEDGYAYIAGWTYSEDYPTTNPYDETFNGGISDSFVTQLTLDGQLLVFSTFLGGSQSDSARDIAVENSTIYVGGTTTSSDYPTFDAYNSTFDGSLSESFVSILSQDSDMDSLSDWRENLLGTNRFNIDSDNDNFLDAYEVDYGTDPLDPMDFPAMPQAWYDAIYTDLDGNATLLLQVISWLEGNHTALETLFYYTEGNATLLLSLVESVGENSHELDLLTALITQDAEALSAFNVTYIEDMAEIREILDGLGITVGDTDYDGLDDLDEMTYGTDILRIDTDNDNLIDAFEIKLGTDPLDDDSDADTYLDGIEVIAGTDPLDPLSYPGAAQQIDPLILIIAVGGLAIIVIIIIFKKVKSRS